MASKSQNEMTFLEHLEELRWHIVRSAIAVLTFSIAAFVLKQLVFDVIFLGPSHSSFITNQLLCKIGICINQKAIQLINFEMAGQFLTHIKISLIAGVVAAFPYIVYELWRFISPALYSDEKKLTKGVIFIIWLLFFIGIAFGYFIICPLSVNFLINYQVTEQAENTIKIMSYVSTIASISLSSGILFQLPVAIFFLSKMGIVTPEILKHYRRHALVIILILSAIITPPDVFSQIMVSVPILLLYEISIVISRRITKKSTIETQ